jgi:hypothetical protein
MMSVPLVEYTGQS